MSIAEKLVTIAENEQKVFNAGRNQCESDFWDAVQNFGNKTDYSHAFKNWNCEYIRPKYKVISKYINAQMFMGNKKLKILEKEYFDLSQGKYSPTSSADGNYATFNGCSELEEVQDIGLQAGHYHLTYAGCAKLRIIEVHRSTKDCRYYGAFNSCRDLEEILDIEGEIGQNGFDVSDSPKLSRRTLILIFTKLTDYSTDTSGAVHSIEIGPENLAKLNDTDKAIAKNKGWKILDEQQS